MKSIQEASRQAAYSRCKDQVLTDALVAHRDEVETWDRRKQKHVKQRPTISLEEVYAPGETIALRVRGHLLGLKMAAAQLGIKPWR
jgi:hypothetical protein